MASNIYVQGAIHAEAQATLPLPGLQEGSPAGGDDEDGKVVLHGDGPGRPDAPVAEEGATMRKGKIKVKLRYAGRAKPPDDPHPEGSCDRCLGFEELVKHMTKCCQPPSRCRTCNELLEKVGMLTPGLKYWEQQGDGFDCFGS